VREPDRPCCVGIGRRYDRLARNQAGKIVSKLVKAVLLARTICYPSIRHDRATTSVRFRKQDNGQYGSHVTKFSGRFGGQE
jgi:hypothetical protein